jgi:ABC-type transporter MlaC component
VQKTWPRMPASAPGLDPGVGRVASSAFAVLKASSVEADARFDGTESFGRYISAIYADHFDRYAGQKLQVTGEQPNAGGVTVKSQIIKANGEPVEVDYMMHRSGAGWLISDIYLDGAISEVATRRSEFAAILKKEGIDGLNRGTEPQGRYPHRNHSQIVLTAN